MDNEKLERFIIAHERDYSRALSEIQNGRKATHWIWYIFPQLKGLGRSSTSDYYGITDLREAKEFLNNTYLRCHLIEISSELLSLESNNAKQIMGRPDDLKFKSSMTLFSIVDPQEKIFQKVLEKYFYGRIIVYNRIADGNEEAIVLNKRGEAYPFNNIQPYQGFLSYQKLENDVKCEIKNLVDDRLNADEPKIYSVGNKLKGYLSEERYVAWCQLATNYKECPEIVSFLSDMKKKIDAFFCERDI